MTSKQVKEPTAEADFAIGEAHHSREYSRVTLNFRHPAGVRQPHDMKTRQRWILMAFTLVAGVVLLMISTGSIKSEVLASPVALTLDLEALTERDKCPACFGVKMCPQIISKKIKLSDWTQYKVTKFVNKKNVYYGDWNDEGIRRKLILKKLAHDHELDALDRTICDRNGQGHKCDVSESVRYLIDEYSHHSKLRPGEPILHGEKIGNGSDLLLCPSHDKMDFLIAGASNFNKGQHKKTILANVLTTILVNSEPIILESFPASKGWPFPVLYGACGRIVVEEYVGRSLASVVDEPFKVRAYLALQLLKMADLFYDNPTDFILYLTDPQADNFAVTDKNIVKLVDLENIIVVDKKALLKSQGPDADKWVEGQSVPCEGGQGKECLAFSVDDMCNKRKNDHNYYAVCAGLLAPGGFSLDFPQGLLHSIPAGELGNLEDLLIECKSPSTGKLDLTRTQAAQQLKEILEKYTTAANKEI